jgi:hypothetical protein
MVWWEIIFMLVVLKIPIVYLCAVVWWAIRAEPMPEDGADGAFGDGSDRPDPRPWWRPPRRRRRPGPHGSPERVAPRVARPGIARARVER